ncbi:hypothetical protein CYMTET_26588 [Cymbomonas tetramitiformis]|uniref:CBM20 domain-containing protein n=1 Tax=Cymbomonas tetramitiformis TaxID=36881 RepID=A0AAE0FS09_9CHLO|nr:hypothetical protein CYMTET_26588 [Cymbomonas tetramitiformis]
MSIAYYACSATHVVTSHSQRDSKVAGSFVLGAPKGLQASTKSFFRCGEPVVQGRAFSNKSRARYTYVISASSEAQCSFTVTRKLSFGDNMLVLGSTENLGEWNPEAVKKMTWSEGDGWSLETTIPADEKVFFKFAVKTKNGQLLWENSGDRVVTCEAGGSVKVTGLYGEDGSTVVTCAVDDVAADVSVPEEVVVEAAEETFEQPETIEPEHPEPVVEPVNSEAVVEENVIEDEIPAVDEPQIKVEEMETVPASQRQMAVSVLAGLLVTLGVSVGAGLLYYDSHYDTLNSSLPFKALRISPPPTQVTDA